MTPRGSLGAEVAGANIEDRKEHGKHEARQEPRATFRDRGGPRTRAPVDGLPGAHAPSPRKVVHVDSFSGGPLSRCSH